MLKLETLPDILSLEQQRDDLENEISNNLKLLEAAKVKQLNTGIYANPSWFSQIKTKIREDTNKLHNINRQLKKIKSVSDDSYFKKAARELLDSDIYEQIILLSINLSIEK